jgi:hypothetical protein
MEPYLFNATIDVIDSFDAMSRSPSEPMGLGLNDNAGRPAQAPLQAASGESWTAPSPYLEMERKKTGHPVIAGLVFFFTTAVLGPAVVGLGLRMVLS